MKALTWVERGLKVDGTLNRLDWTYLTVLVILNDPPNAKIRGFVINVVEQQLKLSDDNY